MKKHSKNSAAILLTLMLFSRTAEANAGTALMWMMPAHLIFGNILIGILEGALLTIFDIEIKVLKAIGVMILANYISAWLGLLAVWGANSVISLSVSNFKFLFVAFMLAAYIFTLLIEYKFCKTALTYKVNRSDYKYPTRTQAWKANITVQTVTYILLAVYYQQYSPASLMTQTDIESDLSFAKTNPQIYFVEKETGTFRRRRLKDKTSVEVCSNVRGTRSRNFIGLQIHSDGSVAIDSYLDRDNTKELVRLHRLWMEPEFIEHYNLGASVSWVDYQDKDARKWKSYCGFWAAAGIRFTNTITEDEIHLAYETPFGQLYIRTPTILPGEQAIFCVGSEIVLFDLNTKQLALIVKGQHPIVIYEEEPKLE